MSSTGNAKMSVDSPSNTRPSGEAKPNPLPHNTPRYAYVAMLIVVIAFFAAVRFRLRDIPLERDEGDYAYVGQLLLHGVLPFKLAGNLKLPGPYPLYALFMALFGQSAAAVHIGLLLVNAVTSVLVFLMGRRLYGPLCGTVAGGAYALATARLSIFGFSAHATHFVLLFAVAGILSYLKAIDSGLNRWLFVAGLLLGTAYIMKQPGILFPLFVFFDLLRREWRDRQVRRLASRLAVYTLGTVLPFSLMCVIFAGDGTFSRFWFWTVTYASAHARLLSISDGWQQFRAVFFKWTTRPRALWFVAGLGLLTLVTEARTRSRAIFVATFLLFSFVAVCPGYYFRPHYFVLLLPAVSLLAGIAVNWATEFLRHHSIRLLPPWSPAMACLLFFAIYVFGQRKIFWEMTPMEVLEDEYPGGLFRQAVAAADYIRSHVPEGEQIAVLGSEPEICFYAQRRDATSYIHIQAFSERQPYAERMQREMIGEIEAARPMTLIDVDQQESWGWTSDLRPAKLNPALALTWKRKYIEENYQLGEAFPFRGYTEHLDAPFPSIFVYLRKHE